MKPLDIVRTPKGSIAWITEVNNTQGIHEASINFIGENVHREHNAWWNEKHLEIIDSIPRMLAIAMAHPFGSGRADAENAYPINKK